jgi:hypothetical protein
MFDRLDFVYLPSRDVAGDLKHFTHGLGAEVVFAIEAFGDTGGDGAVGPGSSRASARGPSPDLDRAIAQLRDRHVEIGVDFEIPHGRGVEVTNPGAQRIALNERTRPGADVRLAGRRDF